MAFHVPSVGLTGGIASGKSTVSRMLAERGAVIIDADALVRELQEPGGRGLKAIVQEFGPTMLTSTGELDRAALGSLVFGDAAARERLNAIIHPLVRTEAAARKAAAPVGAVVVEDIPLLVETGQAARFDHVVVVQAPGEQRIERMVRDRGMSPEAAQERIDAQASDAQRAEVATTLIMNDGDFAHLEAQVNALWTRLHPHA